MTNQIPLTTTVEKWKDIAYTAEEQTEIYNLKKLGLLAGYYKEIEYKESKYIWGVKWVWNLL